MWFDKMSKLTEYANRVAQRGVRLVGITSNHHSNPDFSDYCGVFVEYYEKNGFDCFDKFIAQN